MSRSFFNKPLVISEWNALLENYPLAVDTAALKKKDPRLLPQLDEFWRIEYPKVVMSRECPSLMLSELSKVMTWKLNRGKMRPLQKLVDSNSPSAVVSSSKKAIQFAKKGNWQKAINEIMVLKAVGPATASAILAPLFPSLVPFMSDEVLEVVSLSGNYTVAAYETVQKVCVDKVTARFFSYQRLILRSGFQIRRRLDC
jgi:hypothetical protein